MLVINTKKDIVPSTDTICRMLTASNQLNGMYFDLDRMLEYHFYYRNEAGRVILILYKYVHPNDPVNAFITKGDIIGLINQFNVGYYFKKTAGGDISLDSDSVEAAIASGMLSKELGLIVKNYSYAISCNNKVGQFGTIIKDGYEVTNELSCEYHRMIRIDPIWVAQNTHRFATQAPAVQNIVRECQDVLTVPRGYIKCDADSGQIEPRITYSTIIRDPVIQKCIRDYNDAYFGLLYYNQMPDELWRSHSLDFTVPEVNDEMKANRQKLKTMGNAVLYGSSDTKNGDTLTANYIKRIGNHPMRLAYVRECTDKIMRGDYTFYTAFGEPVDVRNATNATGKYAAASEDARAKHFIRSAFNVAMQGTAAGLMKIALDRQNKFILHNNLKSYIIASVHDAIKTAIHEDEFEKYKDEFAQFPSYQVDDWIPIYSDAEFGPHRVNPVFNDKLRF